MVAVHPRFYLCLACMGVRVANREFMRPYARGRDVVRYRRGGSTAVTTFIRFSLAGILGDRPLVNQTLPFFRVVGSNTDGLYLVCTNASRCTSMVQFLGFYRGVGAGWGSGWVRRRRRHAGQLAAAGLILYVDCQCVRLVVWGASNVYLPLVSTEFNTPKSRIATGEE